MNPLEELLASLAGVPHLPGARCRGRHRLFDPPAPDADPEDADHAQQIALRLCRDCPALAGCAVWFDTLPARQRPQGVVAGRINQPRRGRPRAAGDDRTEKAA
ncbi:hypothetical protein [Mycolicibacterium monacense]|uniref:4Fe-4S Wbl-type domain-containing protein n=1 Tax=Mycolicibacterium monacense TaxID=85693 RepID=A0AAD1IUV2_MYCMB|nr:hypothetical protein [Mycolicibacterium monacense]ORB20034.1 hypothetical protein BST34_13815 [Mycolicibacterium monacense DSM 44395]QHP86788.1 hypothetical protein EWR22_16320 [Mycolicibacterium monacense DSM 44395]BBZ60140.1 hypothetical protein MMON_14410 [Mycolicibacterium monacense]